MDEVLDIARDEVKTFYLNNVGLCSAKTTRGDELLKEMMEEPMTTAAKYGEIYVNDISRKR